jgi:hypothetical protein
MALWKDLDLGAWFFAALPRPVDEDRPKPGFQWLLRAMDVRIPSHPGVTIQACYHIHFNCFSPRREGRYPTCDCDWQRKDMGN